VSDKDLKKAHDRKARALQERISEERAVKVLSEEEIAARLKTARESSKGVEAVATSDGDALLWW
jgi:hypothetical protein